jgi:hypothetical protein
MAGRQIPRHPGALAWIVTAKAQRTRSRICQSLCSFDDYSLHHPRRLHPVPDLASPCCHATLSRSLSYLGFIYCASGRAAHSSPLSRCIEPLCASTSENSVLALPPCSLGSPKSDRLLDFFLEINPVDDMVLETFLGDTGFGDGSSAHRYSGLVDGVRVSRQQRVPPFQ